jgi:hypothetical protein
MSTGIEAVKKFILLSFFLAKPLAKSGNRGVEEGPVTVFTWVNRKKGRKQ